jgi:hypothetical protein
MKKRIVGYAASTQVDGDCAEAPAGSSNAVAADPLAL